MVLHHPWSPLGTSHCHTSHTHSSPLILRADPQPFYWLNQILPISKCSSNAILRKRFLPTSPESSSPCPSAAWTACAAIGTELCLPTIGFNFSGRSCFHNVVVGPWRAGSPLQNPSAHPTVSAWFPAGSRAEHPV